MKASFVRTVKTACFGAATFWTPDVLVHLIRRNSFDSREVWFLTGAMPLISMLALFLHGKRTGSNLAGVALRMLLGIWLFGGVFIAVGATFSGGGFAGPDGVRGALMVIAMSLVPIYTCIMATYDGSLFGLLLISLALLLVSVLPFSWTSTTTTQP